MEVAADCGEDVGEGAHYTSVLILDRFSERTRKSAVNSQHEAMHELHGLMF